MTFLPLLILGLHPATYFGRPHLNAFKCPVSTLVPGRQPQSPSIKDGTNGSYKYVLCIHLSPLVKNAEKQPRSLAEYGPGDQLQRTAADDDAWMYIKPCNPLKDSYILYDLLITTYSLLS